MKNLSITQKLIILIPAFLILLAAASRLGLLQTNTDWYNVYYPAARSIYEGFSPYHAENFNAAPWAVIPLLPMALFPVHIAYGLMTLTSFTLVMVIMWKLKVNWIAAIAFLLSPTFLGEIIGNNIDLIVIGGLLMPPVWGLFFLTMKPQVGLGVIIYYLVETWRKNGFWGTVRVFAPISLVLLISLIIFPIWLERMTGLVDNPWNRSTFPYLIPLGLLLLWLAFLRKNPYFALAASLFFVPYHIFYSLIAVQIGLMTPDVEKWVRRDVLQILLTGFLWFLNLYFKI